MARPSVSAQTRVAAVIGSPVRHSLSPAIHNAAFDALGLDWMFLAFEVDIQGANSALSGVRVLGIDALSVTMPLKGAAYAAADRCSDAAEKLQAVNCLSIADGEMVGHNTDGQGFIRGVSDDLGGDLSGKRVVVVGAGGAARAVLHALGGADTADVVVINRTRSNADDAVHLGGAVARVGTEADLATADLVVNATSLGMQAGDPLPFDVDLLGSHTDVVDLIYGSTQTRLLQAAEGRGLRVADGRSMLLHQAAIAFEIWTGRQAPVHVMREQLLQ